MSAPALHLTPLEARYRVAHDALGWHVLIGEHAACRPDRWGRIRSWMHDPAFSPEVFRRDVELLRAVLKLLLGPGETFPALSKAHSDRRRHVLEALCEAANEAVHAGEVDALIGREAPN